MSLRPIPAAIAALAVLATLTLAQEQPPRRIVRGGPD